MRVLSLNVGLPRTVRWRDRDVTTAIWKEPVAGRRAVRRLNIDGDGQADLVGHGGENRAVYVYQVESYRHWERELGRDLSGWGRFGENLTVEGLADDDVRIGDRLAVGTALFEVSQPRVTCYKLGIRLEEPRMPALLTGHGRPGFYLRVLEEGEIGAGDGVEVVARGPEQLTVARVAAMLYRPDYDADLLRLALSTPALAAGWQWSFRQQLDQVEQGTVGGGNSGLTGSTVAPPAFAGYRPFRVREVVAESRSLRSLVLVPADDSAAPGFRPGQFVPVRLPAEVTGGLPLSRSYSLSGPAGDALRISVKRDGRASALIHDRVGPGTVLDIAAPRGSFGPSDGDGPLALISAGSGVTPLVAVLHDLAATGSARPLWWVHVARSGAEHAFDREVRDLLAGLPAARSHVRYSRPDPEDAPDAAGRLTAADIAALGLPPDTDVLVCGPDGFMAEVTMWLVDAGIERSRIRTETFGTPLAPVGDTPPHEPEDAPATGPAVTFSRSGLTVRFGDGRWASLLELAEASDVPVGWSCRTGVCHICESGLVAGSVTYDPDPLDPPGPGNVLLCCSRPRQDVTLDL